MERTALCTQPHCAIRAPEGGIDRIADLAVACLSGGDLTDVVESGEPIFDRKVCRDCVRRVLYGRRPLPTPDELDRDAEAKRHSRRRHRRLRH